LAVNMPSTLHEMSEFSEEPRFTIEQIDLLQRLRRTGMTKQEILHALDTLDRLDREHGDKFGRRTSSSSSSSSSYGVATQTQFNSAGGLSLSPSNSYDTSPPPGPPPPSNGRDSLAATPNGKLSPPRYPVNSAAATRAFGFESTEEDLDIDDKVEELMRRCCLVFHEGLGALAARATTILAPSHLCAAVLSFCHLCFQTTATPADLLTLSNPPAAGATLNMRPAPLPLEEMEWRQTPPPLTTAPGTFRLRRGSRFTWRKECLAVMESYFNDNQYPDEAKREEIANACNAVIQKPGKKLSDLERVTSLKVYNWFANRRKEIKRRANIATILESHGIDVQSPGGHSNSDDIDGNDFSEQDDSAAHSEHQDPISLAVEMAAVNHTILALSRTGGGPNDIKTESLEDE
uniref:Homeobox containing 1 n=1 Tax=Haplochromis burtoni TaxID=8153 RepID=A0A3Q2VN30_HAPBU